MGKSAAELSKYRYEQAKQCIKSANVLVAAEDYKGAVNRSYYAIFHAMRSVPALENKDFSKHSGVAAYFRKEYIKTGIFDIELSDIISSAFDVRSNSDYDDFYVISKEEVEEQIANAMKFCDEVKAPFYRGFLRFKKVQVRSPAVFLAAQALLYIGIEPFFFLIHFQRVTHADAFSHFPLEERYAIPS